MRRWRGESIKEEGIQRCTSQQSQKISKLFGQFFLLGCYTFGGGWVLWPRCKNVCHPGKDPDGGGAFGHHQRRQESARHHDWKRGLSIRLPCGRRAGGAGVYFRHDSAAHDHLSAITFFYTKFRDNVYVARAMVGCARRWCPSSATPFSSLESAFSGRCAIWRLLRPFALYIFWDVNCILLVLMGIVFGLSGQRDPRQKGGRRPSLLLELFWSFMKIGLTSFGGLSMVPLINEEMIAHGWMNAAEVSDIVAIAEMTPRALGPQLRHLCRDAHLPGYGAPSLQNLGVLMPTLTTICLVAAIFFKNLRIAAGCGRLWWVCDR